MDQLEASAGVALLDFQDPADPADLAAWLAWPPGWPPTPRPKLCDADRQQALRWLSPAPTPGVWFCRIGVSGLLFSNQPLTDTSKGQVTLRPAPPAVRR